MTKPAICKGEIEIPPNLILNIHVKSILGLTKNSIIKADVMIWLFFTFKN